MIGVLTSYVDGQARARLVPLVDGPLVWDSGAFSVFTGRAEVSLEDHTAWVIEEAAQGRQESRFIGLDVIGDPEGTAANYAAQRAAGAPVEPTIHYGDPLAQVERLLEIAVPEWINVGGIVPFLRGGSAHHRNIAAFIAGVRKRIPSEVRIHALGCSTPGVLRMVGVDAGDSSSWIASDKFGELSLFDDQAGRWRSIPVRHQTEEQRAAGWRAAYGMGRMLRRDYGVEPEEITSTEDRRFFLELSVAATARFAGWVSSIHDREFTMYRVSNVSYEALLVGDRAA